MKQKTPYRIRNWPADNAARIGRGRRTLWVDAAAIRSWRSTGPTQRGAQSHDAETALRGGLPLRAVSHLAVRAAAGLARAGFALRAGNWPVPSSSPLSRRAADWPVALGARPRAPPLPLVLDCRGFKVYGEGEGQVRQPGWRKRRPWRKLHWAGAGATGELGAAGASEAGVAAAEGWPDLVAQVAGALRQVRAAGASDKRPGDAARAARGAPAVIPPRRAALAAG
jgi:hypothetical protein